MDIVFAIDRTCFDTQLTTIKSFLIDLIDRNYFTSNTYFGFVLFDDDYVSNEPIQYWTNDNICKYNCESKTIS